MEPVFIIRDTANKDVGTARDLVTANHKARKLNFNTKVYRKTDDGEVLMSYTGPRDRELS